MDNKVKFIRNKFFRQVPFLIVRLKDNSYELSLYSITHNKLYDFQLRVPFKRLYSSSHGWLFIVEESLGVTLMNPFSGATIELPPIMDLSELEPPPLFSPLKCEVTKAILSVNPTSSSNDYIVTAVYGGCHNLAFIRAGDEAWTYVDKNRFISIVDVMYYKGQIFAVDYGNRVLMIDVNRRAGKSNVPQVEVTASLVPRDSNQTYLIESSSGDLLLVQRFLHIEDDSQHLISRFKVFKLLIDQFEQVKVKSLGGDTLFLGDNHSICVSASKWSGCQANSIYYTVDYSSILYYNPPSGRRIGIFNIENGSFETYYILDPLHNYVPPSIWIVPTVLGN